MPSIRPEPAFTQAGHESFDSAARSLAPGQRTYSLPASSLPSPAGFGYDPTGAFESTPEPWDLWSSDAVPDELPTLSPAYEVGKRTFDLALALLIFPVVGVLIAIIGAAIAISTPGPIFFRHLRIGRHGRPFYIWKFRTMRADSERLLAEHLQRNPAACDEWRLTRKLRKDPRITPLGRFLRKSSLDELPQIFNIFAGEMSMVGPRPIVEAESLKYAGSFPYYLAAVPGVTGLWQVSGRCDLCYEDRVALDESYVRQWTMALDLWILLRTPRAVFCRNGAY